MTTFVIVVLCFQADFVQQIGQTTSHRGRCRHWCGFFLSRGQFQRLGTLGTLDHFAGQFVFGSERLTALTGNFDGHDGSSTAEETVVAASKGVASRVAVRDPTPFLFCIVLPREATALPK
jgi:hypothetical protein